MAVWIKDWLILVLISAAIGTCADAVMNAEGAKENGVGKVLRMIITLCVISAVLVPVIGKLSDAEGKGNLFPTIPENDASQYESSYESLVVAECERQLEEELCEYIFEEFRIKPSSCRIQLTEEQKESGAEYVISEVCVYIPKSESVDTDEMSDYIKKLCGCENVGVKESESMG